MNCSAAGVYYNTIRQLPKSESAQDGYSLVAAGCNPITCECTPNAGWISHKRPVKFARFRRRTPARPPARLRPLATPQPRIDVIQHCGYIPNAVHNIVGATLRHAAVSPVQLALEFISRRISNFRVIQADLIAS